MEQPTESISTPPEIASLMADLPLMLTRAETAEVLRSKPDFVTFLIARGELVGVQRERRKGCPVLVPRSSLEAYIARHIRR